MNIILILAMIVLVTFYIILFWSLLVVPSRADERLEKGEKIEDERNI